jgi:uncharacterized protein YraI
MIENPRLVVDVSHYDDHLDVGLLKAAGVAAVIVKSGSGMQRDAKFVQHAQAVADAGLILMAYHWDDILVDPIQQAMWVIEDIASTGLPVKFIWADQEQWWTNWTAWFAARMGEMPYSAVPHASPANISQHNGTFAYVLHALYPQSGVYSNYGFVTSWAMPIKDWIGQYPLWIAHYGRQPKSAIDCSWAGLQKEWLPNYKLLLPPGSKEAWVFGHQFTGDALRLPGVYGPANQVLPVDVSIFSEDFLKTINAGQVPPKPPANPDPPTPPAGAAAYYVNVPALNVRGGPGTQYPIVGTLIKNTTIQVDRLHAQWAHLIGGTSWVWGPYLTAIGPIVEPGPVEPGPADPPANPPVEPPAEPPAEPPKELSAYSVNVPAVNIRSGPGIENPIVTKLYKNTRVCVTEIQGEWAHLDSGNWVFAAYLSPVV